LGVFDYRAERCHAGRAELFKEGSLRFHDGNERGDDVADGVAEFFEGGRLTFQRIAATATNRFRKLLPARVETDAHGVSASAHRIGELVGEVGHENRESERE
jgi:hypothetical protein